MLVGCSHTDARSPDVADSVRASLDEAGFKDVSVSHDRDKGIVTLEGHVPSKRDKARADSLTRSLAGAQVVANQIAVIPAGGETETKAINSDLDQGIESTKVAAAVPYVTSSTRCR